MVLNNFKYFYQGSLFNGTPKLTNVTQKATTGSAFRAKSDYLNNCIINGILEVGTGTSPVKEDDYCLENKITTVTQVSANEVVNMDDGKLKKTFVRTLTYTGAEKIRITEIGLEKAIYWETSSQTGSNYYLLARELLGNPIEIEPQETFTVSITIEI